MRFDELLQVPLMTKFFEQFGVNRIFALKEGGESIPVTQENKREFVQLSANFRLYSSISNQIENLVAGFQEIIPKDLITIVRVFHDELLYILIYYIQVQRARAGVTHLRHP